MTPPYLTRQFLSWLAAQTTARAQQAVVDEMKSRFESGNLGDYQGVLFQNSFQSSNAAKDGDAARVALGLVASSKREIIGVVDKLKSRRETKGNGFQYFEGVLKGVSLAAVVTGETHERARLGTEALVQAFRPLRVIEIGFAAGVSEDLKSGALFVPNRFVVDAGESVALSEVGGEGGLGEEGAEDALTVQGVAPPHLEAKEGSAAAILLQRVATGGLLTVDTSVSGAEARRAAARLSAAAYDKTSRIVAETCATLGAPFFSLKAIFDASERAASEAAYRASRADQSFARTLGALWGAAVKKPSSTLDVLRLKTEELSVADKLASAIELIATALSSDSP